MTSKEALYLLMTNQKKVRDDFRFIDLNTHEKVSIEECYDMVIKDLEMLEILKKKNINIRTLKSWNKTYKGKLTYQNYLDILDDYDLGEKLTQEEYDILKEVLL